MMNADSTRATTEPSIRQSLCRVDDLANGQMKEFEVKTGSTNTTILLIRQNDRFHAYSSKCCHYKLPLVKGLDTKKVFVTHHRHLNLGVLINNRLRCFAHGACFRVDTGDIEDHPGHGNLPSNVNIELAFDHVCFTYRIQRGDRERSGDPIGRRARFRQAGTDENTRSLGDRSQAGSGHRWRRSG